MDSIEIETLEDPATHILSADELALHFLQPFKDTPERNILKRLIQEFF